MKDTLHFKALTQKNCYAVSSLTEDTLFVDIETTGLSAEKNHIYCIGCSYLTGDQIAVRLLFAENKEEEILILQTFADLCSGFDKLITFNGTTFDVPFLRHRFEHFQIPSPLEALSHTDLYQEIRHLKKLLPLTSYKQKSIELFLGINREDQYTGKELIKLYKSYAKDPEDEALQLLQLHNKEDVFGMYDLLEILSYTYFLQGHFQLSDMEIQSVSGDLFFNITLMPDILLPQTVHCIQEHATLVMHPNKVLLSFPVFHGALRHYFPDYKNYYYLPEEHTIIHKSLGTYIDPDHRQKATKENCYLEKSCYYLTLPYASSDHYLKQDLADKSTYLELPGTDDAFPKGYRLPPEQFSTLEDFVHLYCQTILSGKDSISKSK